MSTENYVTESTDGKLYSFTSIGPNGNIPIIIQFEKLGDWKINDKQVYNLGFGVLVQKGDKKVIDDSVITNNGDRDKIFFTISNTVLHFSKMYPKTVVFAQGNQPVKNRIYRIMISNNYTKVSEKFSIYGRINGKWEDFEKGREYGAFMAFHK